MSADETYGAASLSWIDWAPSAVSVLALAVTLIVGVRVGRRAKQADKAARFAKSFATRTREFTEANREYAEAGAAVAGELADAQERIAELTTRLAQLERTGNHRGVAAPADAWTLTREFNNVFTLTNVSGADLQLVATGLDGDGKHTGLPEQLVEAGAGVTVRVVARNPLPNLVVRYRRPDTADTALLSWAGGLPG